MHSPRTSTSSEIFSERTLGELRTALHGHLRRPLHEAETRRVIRAMCLEARALQVPVEKVIVLLKAMWQNLHDSEARTVPRRNEILDRFITISIEEFYAPDGTKGA